MQKIQPSPRLTKPTNSRTAKRKTGSRISSDTARSKKKAAKKAMYAGALGIAGAAALMAIPPVRRNVGHFFRWWYEIFCTCQGQCADEAANDGFVVIGHRGSPVHFVENTLESFKYAIDVAGANGLETDLCMTKDGHIVLYHDWSQTESRAIARALGLEDTVKYCPRFPDLNSPLTKPAHELTLEEFRKVRGFKVKKFLGGQHVEAHILTLEEFLDWAVTKPQLKFMCWDMKIPKENIEVVPRMLDRFREIIGKYDIQFEYVFLTPYVRIMKAMDAHWPHENYVLDNEPPFGMIINPGKFTSVTAAIRWKNAYADTVHPKVLTFAPWTTFRRILQADVQYRNQHNRTLPQVPIKKVLGCTLNTDYKMECLIHLGVDGIMSDDPTLLRKVVEAKGKKLM